MFKRYSKVLMLLLAGIVIISMPLETLAKPSDPVTGNPIAQIAQDASPAVVNIDTETLVQQPLIPFIDDPFQAIFREEWRRFTQVIPMRARVRGLSFQGWLYIN